MKIGVVIASKNGFHHLQDCLPTVVAAAKKSTVPVHVTVVDDHSSDGTLTKAPALFPQVTFLGNPQTGACSARNFGVKHTPCDWICFLDNDVFVEEDFFNTVQKYLNAGVFCVACAGYAAYPRQPGAWEQLDGVKLLGWKKGFPRFTRNVYNDSLPDMAEYPSWGVQGAYFFCQRDYFDRLGGFDELLDPYMLEETDLVYRGLKRGWKVVYAPDTKPRHKCGGTINSKKSARTQFLSKRNRTWFVWKNVHDTPLLWAHWLRFIFSFSPRLWKECHKGYKACRQALLREISAAQKTDRELWEESRAFEQFVTKNTDLQQKLAIKEQVDYLENRLFRYKNKYHKVRKIAFHMIGASLSSLKYQHKNSNKIVANPRVCIELEGGLGDLITGLNWVCAFYKKFSPLSLDIAFHNLNMANAFLPDFVGKVILPRKINNSSHDLVINCIRCPVVKAANIKILPFKLQAYVSKLLDFERENKEFLILTPFKDTITNNIYSSSLKRWHQPDIVDEFNLSEDFILEVKIEDEKQTLQKFNLKNRKYITLNREGGTKELWNSSKIWPKEYYEILVKQLKSLFPSYIFVEIGAGRGPRLKGVDISISGKTTIEEIKAILKNAILHIDGEGGLVHLRHALQGGCSCVLFGPTSPEVYGYEENINLKSSACPIHCEFYSRTWQKKCLKGKRICMESLTPKYVLDRIIKSKLLQKDQ